MADAEPLASTKPEDLVKQAEAIQSVAKAITIFQAASLRAPHVPAPIPQVRFSTGANG